MAMSNQTTASVGGEAGVDTWRWACHHLHSTATVFWAGEAEDGLMAVSEEPEELVEAVVWDTEEEEEEEERKHTHVSSECQTFPCTLCNGATVSYLLAPSSLAASCAGRWTPPLT